MSDEERLPTPLALPTPPTPLIGRATELALLQAQIVRAEVRLLTLTGPPGVGKTRLALAVAQAVHAAFPGGVWFVDLSPISDAALVLPTIAQALGFTVDDASIRVALADCFDEPCLLVLDNMEQVLPAAADLAPLLVACPALAILVTSRAPLNLRWEQTFPVLPLPLPDLQQLPALAQLAVLPSVALFVERAQARHAYFALSADNAATIAALCIALDGLPLAIELAAAQVARLPLATLLAMLHQHLPLPPWGMYDLPVRQQTLHTTIAWSVDLLPPDAQTLFRRLAVFVGGWTVEAAKVVAGENIDTAAMMTALATLVDANLAVPSVGEPPRWTMLQTVRVYATTQLTGSERVDAEQRHTAYYLAVAEQARQVALTPERLVGLALLKRLDVEREEVRAAFERSLHQADDGVQTLQYAVALAPVWMLRGELHSGRAWLTQVVQRASTSSGTPALLVVLSWAATFAYQQGDLDAAHAYHEQCLTLSVQLDDQPRRAAALLGLALLHDVRGAYDQALVLNKQALTVYNVLADVGGRAWVLANMGHVVQQQGDHGRAVTMFAESLRLFTNLADLRGQAWAQIGLGHNAWAQPDVSTAAQHYAASLALFNMLGDVRGIAWATTNSGRVAQAQGDIASALALHAQSLAAYRTVGDARGIARALLYQGETLIAANQGVEAEAALNEALALFTRIGDAPNAARTRVVQESLTADTPAALLTPREQDVLGLVAQGLSNRAIATRLTITSGTVNVHLAAIYRKLGVSSRTAALHAARAQALL